MCRLTAVLCSHEPILLADILTRPRKSIIVQSFNCSEREPHDDPRAAYQMCSLNADGFGVGWYVYDQQHVERPDLPCVFTSLKPAWSDRNLAMIAEKTLSPLVFAHVRASSSGFPTEISCHPFCHGKFMFMHNGCIGEFHRLRRVLLSELSDEALEFALSNQCIDSVLVFAVFISQLEKGVYAPDRVKNSVRGLHCGRPKAKAGDNDCHCLPYPG